MFISINIEGQGGEVFEAFWQKYPDGLLSRDLTFGTGHIFRPTDEHSLALYLEIDPTSLTRGSRARIADRQSIAQYVNDRPYAASSFFAVALWRMLRDELKSLGPESRAAINQPANISLRIPVIATRGDGPDLATRIFAPLGYTVQEQRSLLDQKFPEWGDSPYIDLALQAYLPLEECLTHAYLLIPVLDAQKHYWVSEDEIEKLLGLAEPWLATHPERELITGRYLRDIRQLTREAKERLAIDDDQSESEAGKVQGESELEQRIGLNEQRHLRIIEVLGQLSAASVLDLGCSEGKLLRRLLDDTRFKRITGMDVSSAALARAERMLKLDRLSEARREGFSLIQGSLTYLDARLRGYDAAVLAEVIEHLDEERLRALELSVFGDATPGAVIVTTPNVEYNQLFDGLAAKEWRHTDHRFEWDRAQFSAWAERIANEFGYSVELSGIGDEDPKHGCPTQMAVLRR